MVQARESQGEGAEEGFSGAAGPQSRLQTFSHAGVAGVPSGAGGLGLRLSCSLLAAGMVRATRRQRIRGNWLPSHAFCPGHVASGVIASRPPRGLCAQS